MTEAARRAAEQFLPGPVATLEPVSGGHIHDSWRCAGTDAGGTPVLLLQRLNARVFPRLDQVMDNVQRVTAHLGRRLAADGAPDRERRALTLVPTTAGEPAWTDPAGDWWRAFRFIPRGHTIGNEATLEQVAAAGRAIGTFQTLMSDYTGPRLHESLPGFHDTPSRLGALAHAALADTHGRAAAARADIDRVLEDREAAGALEAGRRQGALPERVVHNDAKLSNVLFDTSTGEALCVIDLDTVMPGLAIHDFGDLVRSIAGTAEEDAPDPSRMTVSLERFAALSRGYIGAAAFLTPAERAHLVTAALIITLEQAARFLADFLEGDRYYRTSRPGQNLARARAQWALYTSLRRAEPALRRITA